MFVVHFVLEIREKDPLIGADKLWRIYQKRFSEEYRVGRDVFRCILHEKGLNLVRRVRAARTTDSRKLKGSKSSSFHDLVIFKTINRKFGKSIIGWK